MATAASMGSDSEFLTLKQDFETWRKTRVHREAIPESLWRRAVELARRLGVAPVSRELRLGFRALKDRLEGHLGKKGPPGRPRGATAFVELPPLGLATAPALGLVVEARHPDGTSLWYPPALPPFHPPKSCYAVADSGDELLGELSRYSGMRAGTLRERSIRIQLQYCAR